MISKKYTLFGPLPYWFIQTLVALALFSAPLVVTGDPLAADTFYVAPDGDDNNPGTLELPLQSLEAARQKVRDHKATFGLGTEGIAVILREGTWTRTQSLVLSSQDGGEPGRPVVWRAFPGETVRVVGAATLQSDWFSLVTSGHSEWDRIDAAAQGNVYVANLSDNGITDYGTLRIRGFGRANRIGALELFSDEEPMQLARWPDPDQHDDLPSHQDFQLTLHRSTQPDVSGGWTKFGTRDGVNAYTRDDLVNGIPYYLYRYTWQYEGRWLTAWFIADQDDGYPNSQNPWWYFYNQDLGTFSPNNPSGATGNPSIENPAAIRWGFAVTETVPTASSFTVDTDRLDRWTDAPDPWFHGLWRYYWADKHEDAISMVPATRTITLSEVPTFGLAEGMPFYALNLLEEITHPGEWYLDRGTGLLYWWPNGTIGDLEIMVAMLEEPLLTVVNAEYLQFDDISFGMGREHLVTVTGGTDVAFEHCRFFGAGNDGIRLAGENHRLEHSEVVDTGDAGVVLEGGDRKSLTPGNHLVKNSEIHRFGRWAWNYMPGIRLDGVGHTASHNHIHDGPHSAILFHGNQHLMEYNEINNVVRFSSDAGAIYAGRRWGYRGNRIEYNYIHHIDSPFPVGEHGVYLDDVLSGVSVFGNLFVEVSDNAIMHGGGRDSLFENNIMVRSGTALNSYAQGVTRITDIPGDQWNLLERLSDEGVDYKGALWCSTWPELCEIPNSSAAILDPNALWLYPEGSVFSRNLGWQNHQFAHFSEDLGTGTFDKFAEIEDNLENTDPRFVNEAAGDYRLAANSPAFSIPGFVDIPFQQMGIVGLPPGDDDPPNVNLPPQAVFESFCDGLNCSFDAAGSLDPDGSIVDYSWSLSDGASASGTIIVHEFSANGSYEVTLTVADNENLTNSVTDTVSVISNNSNPTAAFSFSCDNTNCSFDAAASSDSDGSIVAYNWSFGDGGSESLNAATVSHVYGTGGDYNISLTVEDDLGASASASAIITVSSPPVPNTPPIADFTFTCDGLSCQFDASSSVDPDGEGLITDYSWAFGDGQNGSGTVIVHEFSANGSYEVTLTVADNSEASSMITKEVQVAVVSIAPIDLSGVVAKNSEKVARNEKNRDRKKLRVYVELTWSGASTNRVDLYKNGSFLVTTSNDGIYRDADIKRRTKSAHYTLCEEASSTCSNEILVEF